MILLHRGAYTATDGSLIASYCSELDMIQVDTVMYSNSYLSKCDTTAQHQFIFDFESTLG